VLPLSARSIRVLDSRGVEDCNPTSHPDPATSIHHRWFAMRPCLPGELAGSSRSAIAAVLPRKSLGPCVLSLGGSSLSFGPLFEPAACRWTTCSSDVRGRRWLISALSSQTTGDSSVIGDGHPPGGRGTCRLGLDAHGRRAVRSGSSFALLVYRSTVALRLGHISSGTESAFCDFRVARGFSARRLDQQPLERPPLISPWVTSSSASCPRAFEINRRCHPNHRTRRPRTAPASERRACSRELALTNQACRPSVGRVLAPRRPQGRRGRSATSRPQTWQPDALGSASGGARRLARCGRCAQWSPSRRLARQGTESAPEPARAFRPVARGPRHDPVRWRGGAGAATRLTPRDPAARE